ncbi:MAG: zinc-dependent peptidase, partial [Pseudanabaena sp.]
ELLGHIQIFLKEKQFIGCLGLVVTEEMRVTIAAIACFLLFNRRYTYFPNLRTILIYPNAYVVTETVSDGLVVQQRRTTRLGESWKRDQLVLAWAQIAQDITQWQDGHNVVLHEFAHQLDQEEGSTEGVPILPRQSDFDLWAEVMSRAYLDLCDRLEQNKKISINSYGATSPAEFFAVITETFFEKPTVLVKHYPDLYAVLQRYYHLNPVEWH